MIFVGIFASVKFVFSFRLVSNLGERENFSQNACAEISWFLCVCPNFACFTRVKHYFSIPA